MSGKVGFKCRPEGCQSLVLKYHNKTIKNKLQSAKGVLDTKCIYFLLSPTRSPTSSLWTATNPPNQLSIMKLYSIQMKLFLILILSEVSFYPSEMMTNYFKRETHSLKCRRCFSDADKIQPINSGLVILNAQ